MGAYERLGGALTERIVAGGYPAALARECARRRTACYRDNVQLLVERDVRKLARATGDRFRAGVVLYDGEASLCFGDGLFAVPLRALMTGPRA